MLNSVKTLVVVLACTSVLICLLALGVFATPEVKPNGTRVTFIAQSSLDNRGGRPSLDSGIEY
ncbi:hypothetical protein KSF_106150 [Reticulibacter mediterranei]|uniref:Uncharacterized protein n=1 Tax=Reticulibacter mediterranei TaxID=2778369 RepID=A0A8J3N6P4_9CHLR|nr:hypothetical protein KSF_106150 [Reticulibacter mediterranei]